MLTESAIFGKSALLTLPALSSVLVARIGGLPMSLAGRLAAGDAVRHATETNRLEDQLSHTRAAISALLYLAVPTIVDKRARGRVITLRRDIFNVRVPGTTDVTDVAALLPPEAARALLEHMALLRTCELADAAGCAAYELETARCRARFQELVSHDGFQKGLQFASRSLAANLSRYTKASVERPLAARDEHIERGLLRYWTRMACKATPFGSFCTVIRGRQLSEAFAAGSQPVRFRGNLKATSSRLRLSKELQRLLYAHLLKRSAFRRTLRLSLNPTVAVDSGNASFVSGEATQEHCRRVHVIPAVARVLEVVRTASITMADAAVRLAADPVIDATPEGAETFLAGLADIGLLRLRSGLSDQDADWDVPFAELAEASGDEHGLIAAKLLRTLREAANALPHSAASAREPILAHVCAAVGDVFARLGFPKSAANLAVLFEDVTADAEVLISPTPSVTRALDGLKELLALLLPIGSPRDAMAAMRHYFDSKYEGPCEEGTAVSLLRFYEDYFREHYQAHLEYEAALKPTPDGYRVANPFGLAVVEERRQARDALTKLVAERLAHGEEEVTILRRDIERLVGPLGSIPCAGLSFSAFVQIVPDRDGGVRVIFPQSTFLPGHGKYFSRFLYLLEDDALAEIRTGNRRLSAAAQLAELESVGSSNANLHPPLVDAGIHYLSGESGDMERAIETTELEVTRDPADPHGLILRERSSGARVIPLDLGFLNPRQRPPLFRLLRNFIPVRDVRVPNGSTVRPSKSSSGTQSGIEAWPRLTYEGVVVLRRRTWTIPCSTFPRCTVGETSWSHFRRVAQWRKAAGLPRFAYIRIYPAQSAKPAEGEQAPPENAEARTRNKPMAQLASREWYKPQYMDFCSPLLVALLGRMTAGLTEYWVLCEEQLPGEGDLPVAEAEPYVSELVLQLDFNVTPEW